MNIIKIIALTAILLLTGCIDSDLERENSNLQRELNHANKFNTQLEMKLNKLKGLEQELNSIRKNNKELSVSLAKSEVDFFKQQKEEMQKEEAILEAERTTIEDNAQLLAEKNAKNKYMMFIATLGFLFLAFIVFSFFKRNEYNKIFSDKEKNIEQLNKSIVELNQRVEERTKLITSLEVRIKEMEIRAKEGSINQVVRKIDENQEHRSNLLKRIEKELADV